jgi:O-acetyl-ADP-ribose deacetylase (regulator of RNase III)
MATEEGAIMSINVVQGSILDFEGDCIVNPANSFLQHGGGLACIIDEAAQGNGRFVNKITGEFAKCRPEGVGDVGRVGRWQEDNKTAPNVATGDAYMTSAGLLPYKNVIHAVGPIWAGGNLCEGVLLTRVHHKTFKLAYDAGLRSIAVPAISCGIFGYPVELAASTALDAASWWGHLLDITFVLFSDEDFDAYAEPARLYNAKVQTKIEKKS